jgi:hypothetical protein
MYPKYLLRLPDWLFYIFAQNLFLNIHHLTEISWLYIQLSEWSSHLKNLHSRHVGIDEIK